MVEQRNVTNRTPDCYQESHIDNDGNVVLRDMVFHRGEQAYRITVAKPEYLNKLREYNQQFPPESKLDETALAMDDISTVDKVCSELSSLPFETLQSFVSEKKNVEVIDQP